MFDFLSSMIMNPNLNILGRVLGAGEGGGSVDTWTVLGQLGVGGIFYALYVKGDKERVAANQKLVTVLENTTPLLTKVATVLERVEQGMQKTAEKVETADPNRWQGDLERTLEDVKRVLSERK